MFVGSNTILIPRSATLKYFLELIISAVILSRNLSFGLAINFFGSHSVYVFRFIFFQKIRAQMQMDDKPYWHLQLRTIEDMVKKLTEELDRIRNPPDMVFP